MTIIGKDFHYDGCMSLSTVRFYFHYRQIRVPIKIWQGLVKHENRFSSVSGTLHSSTKSETCPNKNIPGRSSSFCVQGNQTVFFMWLPLSDKHALCIRFKTAKVKLCLATCEKMEKLLINWWRLRDANGNWRHLVRTENEGVCLTGIPIHWNPTIHPKGRHWSSQPNFNPAELHKHQRCKRQNRHVNSTEHGSSGPETLRRAKAFSDLFFPRTNWISKLLLLAAVSCWLRRHTSRILPSRKDWLQLY